MLTHYTRPDFRGVRHFMRAPIVSHDDRSCRCGFLPFLPFLATSTSRSTPCLRTKAQLEYTLASVTMCSRQGETVGKTKRTVLLRRREGIGLHLSCEDSKGLSMELCRLQNGNSSTSERDVSCGLLTHHTKLDLNISEDAPFLKTKSTCMACKSIGKVI